MSKAKNLSAAEIAALKAARHRDDVEIDLSDPDAPQVSDWSAAIRGGLVRPVNQPVTIRFDADVVAWFKRSGDGYQTRINEILREHIERQGTLR